MKIQSIAILLAIGLGGCAHETGLPDFYAAETEAKFGAAVRQNIAAQVVNPNAPEGELSASGARAAIAQKRYEEDEVEKPKAESTLRAATSSGSGGGSNN